MTVMIVIVCWMLVGYISCGWALKEVLQEGPVMPPFVVFLLTLLVLLGWPVVLGYALYKQVNEKER